LSCATIALIVDGVLRPGYSCAFSSKVLACSTVGTVPFVATLMASTPRASSRAAETFAAGQVNVEKSVSLKASGPVNPSAGDVRGRDAANRGGVLCVLRGDRHQCRGGGEQREPPAAGGTEGGPRDVGEAEAGEQRAGTARPPGDELRRCRGEPRARADQGDDD